MAGYVPNDWAARLLEATVGRTAINAGPVYLGLAFDVPEDPMSATLSNISEVDTTGYARVEIPAFKGAVVSPVPAITTPTTFAFPSLSEDMAQAATHAFLTDTDVGVELGPPTTALGATGTSGGTFSEGTYFWVVTATNSRGETVKSNEVTATLVANGTQEITWATVLGATGYKIYRGMSSGSTDVLVESVGEVTTFTDTGAAGTANTTPPSVNSTAMIRYLWELPSPILGIADTPIQVPANTLIIE